MEADFNTPNPPVIYVDELTQPIVPTVMTFYKYVLATDRTEDAYTIVNTMANYATYLAVRLMETEQELAAAKQALIQTN